MVDPHIGAEAGPGGGDHVRAPRTRSAPPAHVTLLDLAEACDIPTRWSCRTGVCHTCITHFVAGDITYTTPPLELPEPGTVLVCCSKPTTEVVLDL
ncbi:2Fe-2S iron-sulfur cluster-binding protein [Streptomyces sp. NPDC001792]|uniref:2Fe-2S iron-sulfur cluster-binding protein n=1 Tax=Streptomyces sp. NPDC001792 TaxID=3154524 RepID=UPI0033171530